MVVGVDDALIAAGVVASAAIGAGAGIAGGAMSNQANANAAFDSYVYNSLLQNQQNRWYERYNDKVRRTAHQYEMSDLMKAGLNPVLTATGGSGAYSSGGSNSAQSVSEASTPYNIDVANMAQLFNDMRNQKRQTDSNVKLQTSQTKLNEKNEEKADREIDNLMALTDKYINEIENNTALTQSTILNNNAKTIAEIDFINKQSEWLPYNAQTNRIGANASYLGASAADYSAKNDPKKIITDIAKKGSGSWLNSARDYFGKASDFVQIPANTIVNKWYQGHQQGVNDYLLKNRNKLKGVH